MYKARDYISKESLLSLHYAYINTHRLCQFSMSKYDKNKLKENPQSAKACILFRKDKFSRTKELFVQNKVFYVFKLNTLNNLIFMHNIRNKTAPAVFLPKFQKPAHPYPTNFSNLNYTEPMSKLSRSNYRIFLRGPVL